jgi:tRNA-dihydrouridine synthase
MMRETGCDGVVVGRGCLGRPWLFRDLADVFSGRAVQEPPNLGEVVEIMREHAKLLADWFGERRGLVSFRRHAGWYTKGFPGGSQIRQALVKVNTLGELDGAFGAFDPDTPFPLEAMRMKRGKRSGTQRVALPEGYLDDRLEDATPPDPEAESADSGG